MKTNQTYIFVDDGYPEASDYDNNFVSYDPTVRGSRERALTEVKTRSLNSMQQAVSSVPICRPAF